MPPWIANVNYLKAIFGFCPDWSENTRIKQVKQQKKYYLRPKGGGLNALADMSAKKVSFFWTAPQWAYITKDFHGKIHFLYEKKTFKAWHFLFEAQILSSTDLVNLSSDIDLARARPSRGRGPCWGWGLWRPWALEGRRRIFVLRNSIDLDFFKLNSSQSS